ncbi:MAG: DUF2442 domain-containing protein [Firmicutes bacterium]|nr:DUF2442 domain-containing protein [Bacillota bacterium]
MQASVVALDPRAVGVSFQSGPVERLIVELADGRIVGVPLAWSPRLARATAAQRTQWELVAGGRILHWPAVDEDIDVRALLATEAVVVPPDEDLGIHPEGGEPFGPPRASRMPGEGCN